MSEQKKNLFKLRLYYCLIWLFYRFMLKDKIAILTVDFMDYKKGHLFKIIGISPYGIVSISSEYILIAVDLKTGEPCKMPLIPYSNCDIVKNSEIIKTLYNV